MLTDGDCFKNKSIIYLIFKLWEDGIEKVEGGNGSDNRCESGYDNGNDNRGKLCDMYQTQLDDNLYVFVKSPFESIHQRDCGHTVW